MTDFLQQLINGLSLGAIYALIALGYTMVYGVLRFINFAHGDVFMVGAVTALVAGNAYLAHFGQGSTLAFLLVLVVAMIASGILGFLIELLAYRPLRSRPRLTVLITAIGVSLLLEYGFQHKALFGPDARVFPTILPWADSSIEIPMPAFAGGDSLLIAPLDIVIVGLTLLLTVALASLIKFTKIGMAIRAVSFRFDTASLMGINVNRIISLTFVLGSCLAAAAGVFWSSKYPKVEPLMGLMPGIKAFVAAVLGGIGNISGAVLGGIVLGVIEIMAVAYMGDNGSQYRDAIAFIILIGMLLLRPSGLLGTPLHEKV
jgi:branched-chain amino acid transport system permease protein